MNLRRLALVCLLLFLAGSAVLAQQPQPVRQLVPEVINTYPHDPQAYTQGLLWFDGRLYESTGLRGQSSLREVDPVTGDVLRIVPVLRTDAERASGEREYFAEGLALAGDRLIQLTWQENTAFVYDLATFDLLETYEYEGEGWGLCYDERYLFQSDGTSYMTLRDATTFERIIDFAVTLEGRLIIPGLLNELECVGDSIYANLWKTDFIVEIDKFSGQIIALIDASGLLTEEERARYQPGVQVLNGIAYNPETDTFWITGKQWDTMYEVRFVPAQEE